jgi:hydrogenase nickel incorporation protein HypA/HybF
MHDWHLANEILKTVLDYATKNGLKNVSKVKLELGSIIEHGEDIVPENLRHNFKLLAEGTPAEKAKLEIKKIRGDIWKIVDIEGDR